MCRWESCCGGGGHMLVEVMDRCIYIYLLHSRHVLYSYSMSCPKLFNEK